MPHILLVDEDSSYATVFARGLDTVGFTTEQCGDARSALTYLADSPEASPVAAIITEVLLPGRNGLKLIQDIRLLKSHVNTPIIILTALTAADVGLAASLQEALGIGAYFVKQQTRPEDVASAVRYALEPA